MRATSTSPPSLSLASFSSKGSAVAIFRSELAGVDNDKLLNKNIVLLMCCLAMDFILSYLAMHAVHDYFQIHVATLVTLITLICFTCCQAYML